MSCPNCKASMANLRRCDEILGCGTRLEAISCILCGFRVERPAPGSMSKLQVLVSPTCAQHFEPCSTLGCDGRIKLATNKTGICGDCSNRLGMWSRAKTHRVKSPIQKFNNIWIKRDYRYLPGVA